MRIVSCTLLLRLVWIIPRVPLSLVTSPSLSSSSCASFLAPLRPPFSSLKVCLPFSSPARVHVPLRDPDRQRGLRYPGGARARCALRTPKPLSVHRNHGSGEHVMCCTRTTSSLETMHPHPRMYPLLPFLLPCNPSPLTSSSFPPRTHPPQPPTTLFHSHTPFSSPSTLPLRLLLPSLPLLLLTPPSPSLPLFLLTPSTPL